MTTTTETSTHDSTIAVVIPTYNRATWLGEVLEAAIAQTRRPDVVVVADNGSTDETASVVARYADTGIVRHLRRSSNIDPILNQNEALAQVETDYVILVPDDDRIYPDFLRQTSALLDASPNVGVVHTRFDVIDQRGTIVLHDIALVDPHSAHERGAEFIRRHMIDRWRVGFALARTDALRAVGFLAAGDRADWLNADMVMWMETAVAWDFGYVPITLAAFRIHEGTLTATRLGLGSHGYALARGTPDQYLDVRTRFVERRRSDLDNADALIELAQRSWRLDRIDYVSQTTFPERRRRTVVPELWAAFRGDRRVAIEPSAWRLLGVSLLGPTITRRLRGLKRSSKVASPA